MDVADPLPDHSPATSAAQPVRGEFADSRAAVRFDTFLFAAAATVLITRTILAASGYPQVGGGGLHVAHVLWGGLLLGIAMTIMMISLGSAAKFWASLVGGVGFGLFIDEIGKFLTKDVNYFFRPAIAIIYGVLITAYVVGRELLARRELTSARVRAIAAIAVADDALGQLTPGRLALVRGLLASYCDDPQGALLDQLLGSTSDRHRTSFEESFAAAASRLHRIFVALADRRWARTLLFVALAVQTLGSLVVDAIAMITVLTSDTHPSALAVTTFAGSATQTLLVAAGLLLVVRGKWGAGLRLIRAGLFVTLMFTLVMEFAREQFGALADFVLVAALITVVGATISAERRGDVGPRSARAPGGPQLVGAV